MTLTDFNGSAKKEEDDRKGETRTSISRRRSLNTCCGEGLWAYPIARAESVNNCPPIYQWMWTKTKCLCVIVCNGCYQKTTKRKKKKDRFCLLRRPKPSAAGWAVCTIMILATLSHIISVT